MKQQANFLLWIFVFLCIGNLCGEYLRHIPLVYSTKPLLLTVLGLYFYQNSSHFPDSFRKYLLGGLVFSVLGDTLLMFVENGPDRSLFFLLGLGSFLITHLCYLQAFRSYPSEQKGWVRRYPVVLLPFALFLLLNTIFLWPDLPNEMKIPVTVYSLAIIAMSVSAANLYTKIPSTAFWLLLGGVLFFVLSDSLIALNKFKSTQLSLPSPRLLIMIFYLLGQYLIVRGCLQSWPTPKKSS